MGTDQSLTFGTLLKRQRRTSGLTQEELAERAELSVEAVSALERGVSRAPRKDTVLLLAEALGLSASERALFEAAARRRDDGGAGPMPASPTGAGDDAPLVGRADALATLDRHLAGRGPAVLLFAGEPGIGKSRLLREAAIRGRAAGWCVLSGACLRRSVPDPYAPVLEAIQNRLRNHTPAQLRADLRQCERLVRLLPELADGGALPALPAALAPDQERRLAFGAVSRFLANIAGPAGTLLVLDDLQWAGADALDLMTSLVQLPSEAAVRVVGAYRDTEVTPRGPLAGTLADLARAHVATQVKLGPLSSAEQAELLNLLLGAERPARPEVQEHMLLRAGGVPFFLVSCAQGLRDGAVTGDRLAEVPWDVAETIRQRLAALPEMAGELVNVAAVAEHRVDGALLVRATARPEWAEGDLRQALDAACRARMLVEVEDDRYEFAYNLIREVVWNDLGSATRATLHRRIAEALEREPGRASPELLAYHLIRAGRREQAVMFLEQAGDAAEAVYATSAAEGYYRELVAQLDALGWIAQRARAQEKLGGVLRIGGRYDDALATLERAVQDYRLSGDAEGKLRGTAAIGRVHARRGTPDAGLARVLPAMKAVASGGPTAGVAALEIALADLYHASGRHQDQLAAAERAAAIAAAIGDERLLTQAEQWRSGALLTLGRSAEAVSALEEVIPAAEALGDLSSHLHALNSVALAYIERGEFDKSSAYIDRALAAADVRGDPVQAALMTCTRGVLGTYTGAWRQARADFEKAAALLRALPLASAPAYPLAGLGRLRLLEGERDTAESLLREAVTRAERSGDLQTERVARTAMAERDLLDGQPEEARAHLERLLARGVSEAREGDTEALALLAWSHLDAGDLAQADEVAQQSAARALADQHRPALAEALRVRAMVAMRERHWEEAEGILEQALALGVALRYPYAEARVLYQRGLLEVARGDAGGARAHLQRAAEILAQLGERLYAERVRAALAAQ